MKRISFSSILVTIGLFGVLLFLPYIFDVIIDGLSRMYDIQIPFYFNLDNWYDVMSIALPAALTYLVIRQSEQQQRENDKAQQRMEHLNARMLDIELKSKMGYLLPYFKLKDAGLSEDSRRTYPHYLKEHLKLVNAGDDDLFITSVEMVANNTHSQIPCNTALYVSKKPPFNEFCIEWNLDDKTFASPQIDVKLDIEMKNTKGYKYRQILYIGFENNNGTGTINRFNMDIQEATAHAD